VPAAVSRHSMTSINSRLSSILEYFIEAHFAQKGITHLERTHQTDLMDIQAPQAISEYGRHTPRSPLPHGGTISPHSPTSTCFLPVDITSIFWSFYTHTVTLLSLSVII
jgi:hypothetical protein